MGKLTKILKHQLYHLSQLAIGLVSFIIMLVASVITFPLYLCSLLSRHHEQPNNPKNRLPHNDIEHQFCEYMIVQKSCTHKHINIGTACRTMGVTPKELTEYLSKNLNTTFNEVVHTYRIEEAKELWEKSGKTPIRIITRAVGYGNNVSFLLHFLKHEHCLPRVWKKRNLIII